MGTAAQKAAERFQWSIDEFRHTPEALLDIVRAGGFDLGFAHDGDAGRVDGDEDLALLAVR